MSSARLLAACAQGKPPGHVPAFERVVWVSFCRILARLRAEDLLLRSPHGRERHELTGLPVGPCARAAHRRTRTMSATLWMVSSTS
jgi:hypothetical protein